MFKRLNFILLLAAVVLSGCKSVPTPSRSPYSHFTGIDDFSGFTRTQTADGGTVLLSPVMRPGMDWNELIVSWNATATAGTWVKIEASAQLPDHATAFYTMGIWSPDDGVFPRTSIRGQRDADGRVVTDTLMLKNPAQGVQLRVTLGGTNGAMSTLKFLGLSFCNTKAVPVACPPDQSVWGKIIPTPERSQDSYPQEKGWCSPTSLSMDLARWSDVLHRPEMALDVPEVAEKVYDEGYRGTGNWPFNTAFAGSFDGMRAYVTRFDDISELEKWVKAGIPVIISARWDLLRPGRPFDDNGHLTVCIGFTDDGDVVINDPATNLKRGDKVRHIYKRADVIKAWATSHNTVYLVYPIDAKLPRNRWGQW